jgi:hypothetical protein
MRIALLLAALVAHGGCRTDTLEWEVVLDDAKDPYDSIIPASFRVGKATRLTVRISHTFGGYSAPTNLKVLPDSTTLTVTTPSIACFDPLGVRKACDAGRSPEAMTFMVTPGQIESSSIRFLADNIDTQNVFDYTATP